MDSVKRRSFRCNARRAEMYAYKDVFGGVAKVLKYIFCRLMDFSPPLQVWDGACNGTVLKQTQS